MPELPEVENIVNDIKAILVNKIILYVIVINVKLRWHIPIEIRKLKNVRILNIYRRGRYIIFKLSSGYIVIHLGMTGSLFLLFRKLTYRKHDHLDLCISNDIVLRYFDVRRFGFWLWFNDKKSKNIFFNKFGPEPLSNNFNYFYLYKLTRFKRISIKNLLMNNKYVVGIGNIYANESLFYSKIMPIRLSMSITFNECILLVNVIKKILLNAIKNNGTTIKDFRRINGKSGSFKKYLQVYGRKNKLCNECNNLLIYFKQNGRSSFFCKYCQF